ncbi:hypothetical protein [Nocardioides ferulae]|uniref:hypothetical protein n=1 Tax=Nocardioides ferulae TaxID=2340821 RepID=UPI0013DE4D16|nr:hypothetical protein [Nocardioides ferulae]
MVRGGVDSGLRGEVEDRLELHVRVAQQFGEALGEHRAEAFDAGESGLPLEGGLVEVDVHRAAGAE